MGAASRGRDSPRRATYFSLLRQRKVGKRKAIPLSATPSLRYGATCGARASRGLAQTRFAQTRASPDPRNAALLGAARGEGRGSGHRVARPPRHSRRCAPAVLGMNCGIAPCRFEGSCWRYAAVPGTESRLAHLDRISLAPKTTSQNTGSKSTRGPNPWPSKAKASPGCSRSRAKRWHGALPSGCAEERRRRRDKGRSCLSATQWSEFCGPPPTSSTAGCP